MNIAIYGLQRSGTNYLEALLRRRYRMRIANENEHRDSPLQKHFRLYDDKSIISEPAYENDLQVPDLPALRAALGKPVDGFVIVSKDPYSWHLSYVRWARKHHWAPVAHHYAREYALFYGKWLALGEGCPEVRFLRYRDLLADTEGELERLEKHFSWKRRFTAGLRGGMLRRVARSDRFTDERRDWYLNERYLKDYSAPELAELNAALERSVVRDLGYELRHSTASRTHRRTG